MIIPEYIVHYYYSDSIPFRNLSDLQEQERHVIVNTLNERFERKEIGRAFPEWYMAQRLEAEQNMRTDFIRKGGKPQRTAPHYLTLGNSPLFEKLYGEKGKKLIFNVHDFAKEQLCFCLNDSLWTMSQSKDPQQKFNCRWFEGQVYSYNEAAQILRELHLDVENPNALQTNKVAFVEALVWTDDIFSIRKR